MRGLLSGRGSDKPKEEMVKEEMVAALVEKALAHEERASWSV
jgi:hypothetical protein